jgi:GNAT superfamily N-acetyltransferase
MSVDLPTPEGVTVWLVEKTGQSGPYLSLDKIQVADERRRQGLGSATMLDLCRLADQRGVIVALTPGDDWGTSKAFLQRWYRTFGFIPNKGRRADLSVSGTMIRFPRPIIAG